MLGIRLDAETEAGLARIARRTGRTKSDIARDAIRSYLAETEHDEALDRELAMIAAAASEADLGFLDHLGDDLAGLIDQEEGRARGTSSH